MTKRILLGHVGAAHGIRGEVTIRTYTAAPEDIAAYGVLTDETGQREVRIEAVRVTGKGVIARLAGVRDRNAAEALRGLALTVARTALPAISDGDYYLADLIGLRACAPDGTRLGVVVTVQNFGAGDLLEVRLDGATQTEYVPFTDRYVPTVDVARGELVVILPEMVGDPEPKDETPDGEEKVR